MNLSEKIAAKIKWLRTQPESVKTRYVWIFGLIVFAIVVSLWVGVFKKYERVSPNDSKNMDLFIEEGKKLKKDINNEINFPGINLPVKATPLISPELSPAISPLTSPGISPFISPQVSE